MSDIIVHLDAPLPLGYPTPPSTASWTPSEVSRDTGGASSTISRGILVTFQDVSYTVPAKGGSSSHKYIIQGITGFLQPGTMTAVMGPSGSGKTTLLDALAGRKPSAGLGGSVRYGGLPPSLSLLRRATGYVEQFDTLVAGLSCADMLLYTAQLKRPRSEPAAAKAAAVEQLLARLGLSGCASTPIASGIKRGLSGGQAKRLNIGIALITDPRVLFLDEPTSGLDSFTACEVLSVVAGLAADGTTIATTIHSPSAACFGLFDRLLVLLGGRTVYLGGAGRPAIEYFTGSCGAREPRLGDNLAEWMLEAVTQAERSHGSDGAAKLASAFCRSSASQANLTQLAALAEEQFFRRSRSNTIQELQQLAAAEDTATGTRHACIQPADCLALNEPGGRGGAVCCGCTTGCGGFLGGHAYVTPAWWGLKVLLQHRTLRNYVSPDYVLPRLAEKLLFAAVIISLYFGKGSDLSTLNVPVLSSLLFLQVLAPLCAAMMYLPSIGLERTLYVRERADGLYRPATYLAFKLLDELLLMAPVTAGTSAAVFAACSLRGSWLLFWVVQYGTLSSGTALAYFLACVSPALMVAMPLLSFLLILSLMTCGYMIRTAAMPMPWSWLVNANVVHYSFAALMVNQYGSGSSGAGTTGPRLGSLGVLDYFGFGADDAWHYAGMVWAFALAWTLLAWLALVFMRTSRR